MRRLSRFPVSWAITIVPDTLLPKRRSSRRESLENMNLGRHPRKSPERSRQTAATLQLAGATGTAARHRDDDGRDGTGDHVPIDRNSRDLKSISRIKSCV